jgi:hypothetical protein
MIGGSAATSTDELVLRDSGGPVRFILPSLSFYFSHAQFPSLGQSIIGLLFELLAGVPIACMPKSGKSRV